MASRSVIPHGLYLLIIPSVIVSVYYHVLRKIMLFSYVAVFFISLIPDVQLHIPNFKGGNYGPYMAECSYFKIIYPDHKNLSYSTANIETIKDKYFIHLNTTIFIPAQILEIKIFVYKINNTKEVLWQYRVKNPCQHYALAGMLEDQFHVDKQCIVKKGIYSRTLNLSELLTAFFGTSFFYGDYMFKANTISAKGSVTSLVIVITFKKKIN